MSSTTDPRAAHLVEIPVQRQDLEKIQDALVRAVEFHERRDQMNAALHQAVQVRYSPLTVTLVAQAERIGKLLMQ
jgi:hypothetical protein